MKIGVFTKRISPYEPWTFAKVTGINHELIMKIGENKRISPYEPWTFAKVTGIIHELIMKIGETHGNSSWTVGTMQHI